MSNERNDRNRRQNDDRRNYNVKVLQLDLHKVLIDETRVIANERGVSLYGQIRDFVEEGIESYKSRQKDY